MDWFPNDIQAIGDCIVEGRTTEDPRWDSFLALTSHKLKSAYPNEEIVHRPLRALNDMYLAQALNIVQAYRGPYPDALLLSVGNGVNDATATGPTAFRAAYKALLDHLYYQWPKSTVFFAMSPLSCGPDGGADDDDFSTTTPAGRASIMQDVAESYGGNIVYVDTGSVFSAEMRGGNKFSFSATFATGTLTVGTVAGSMRLTQDEWDAFFTTQGVRGDGWDLHISDSLAANYSHCIKIDRTQAHPVDVAAKQIHIISNWTGTADAPVTVYATQQNQIRRNATGNLEIGTSVEPTNLGHWDMSEVLVDAFQQQIILRQE